MRFLLCCVESGGLFEPHLETFVSKYSAKISEINTSIVECKLKACQCCMIVGWEKDKISLGKLKEAAEKLIEIMEIVKEEDTLKKYKMYLSSIQPQIESGMEIELNWKY